VILARVDGFVRSFQRMMGAAAGEAPVDVGDTYPSRASSPSCRTMIALRRSALQREPTREEMLAGVRGLGFRRPPRLR